MVVSTDTQMVGRMATGGHGAPNDDDESLGETAMRRLSVWGMRLSALVLTACTGYYLATILVKEPRHMRLDTGLRPAQGVQKLRLFRDFRPRLVLPAAKDEWVSFSASEVTQLFNEHERESMPSLGANDVRHVHCDNSTLPTHCCIGSSSLLGYIRWYEEACQHANFLQMPRDAANMRDMADVLSLLGPNKTLTFVGDSVASQHAYASECSWLRSGKASTVSRVMADTDHVFQKNGSFSQRSRYGTNFLMTWTVDTAASTPQGSQEKAAPSKVQLYMQYRPVNNTGTGESLQEIAAGSDMVVVNFGLHYVQREWEREYRPEMTAMLRELVTFASTPGKVLVWRENSAQHHLSDGGEWPPFIGGTGLREETFEAFKDRCHTLRFRHESWPMYRDKVVLRVASMLGYTVQALGVNVEDCEGSDWKVSDDGKRCLKMPNATTSSTVRLPTEGPVLYWLPFYGLTAERHDLHPYNEKRFSFDCTHFCYTPYLWAPLCDGMAMAVIEAQQRLTTSGPQAPAEQTRAERPPALTAEDRMAKAKTGGTVGHEEGRHLIGCVTTDTGDCVPE